MNTKWIVGIVVALIIIAGGWYFLQNKGGKVAQPGQVTTTQQAAVDPAMIGTWSSTDDAKFIRKFSADGMVTDSYEGEASSTDTGTYTAVDPLQEPSGAFGAVDPSSLTGMTVIKTTFTKSGVMYFGVQSVDARSLKLIYIGRGNTLSFTKVQ